MKNNKKDILHFSINTTQVPCCTHMDLTSLYFCKNNISIDKGCTLPLTQSFAVQLICLDNESLYAYMSIMMSSAQSSPSERLRAIHAVTAQAIEEERTRRETLLRLRSSQSDDSWVISSYQYRDLLSMDLDIFNSPRPVLENSSEHGQLSESPISNEVIAEPLTKSLSTGEDVLDSLPIHPLAIRSEDPTSDEITQTTSQSNSSPPPLAVSNSHTLVHSASSDSVPTTDTVVTAKLRKLGSQHVADPYNDRFAHRIPFLKQMSLSYGEDECTNAMTLSVQLPPQKEKGKKRDLTIHEKEILSKEG